MAYEGIPGCERMARNLMEVHGLTRDGWSFQWDRAKRRAGLCRHDRKVISISRPLAELWGPDGMRDTVLHEIAHAIAGYEAGHGAAWKMVCTRIGAQPERCYRTGQNTLLPAARYIGTCPNGHTYGRERAPADRKSCPECSPRFDERYLLTWTENT